MLQSVLPDLKFQPSVSFTKSENWLCFCHVHMLAIVFSDPFWLKVTKELLLSSLSSSMPCFTLPSFLSAKYLGQFHFQRSFPLEFRSTRFRSTTSENWLCFCYVHVLANLFSDPFWLKVTKGLLLRFLSSSMPCFTLPCSGPIACCFVAPKSATWSEIPDKC